MSSDSPNDFIVPIRYAGPNDPRLWSEQQLRELLREEVRAEGRRIAEALRKGQRWASE